MQINSAGRHDSKRTLEENSGRELWKRTLEENSGRELWKRTLEENSGRELWKGRSLADRVHSRRSNTEELGRLSVS
jgi:hypothetical protein